MNTKVLRCCTFLLALAASGSMPGCSKGETAVPGGTLSGKITMDGSSTVLPLSAAMAQAFHQLNPAVSVAVDSSGTGGGFRKFCAGELDIADASRPINAAEAAQCQAQHIDYIELPVAFDSLAVVVNAKNNFVDCLTVGELKAIWEPAAEGKIIRWKQVRASFPAQPLTLFGPGKDSGTFDYFSLAIVGTESSSRRDFAKSEDDSVIERGIAADPNALGYFGYSYYAANKDELKIVPVDNGHGCILPSPQAVADGSYKPLSRPLFVYVSVPAASRPEVKAFVRFYLAPDNTKYVEKVGYVPLHSGALLAQASRLDKQVTGSALGSHGSVTGVNFEYFDDEKERDRVRAQLVQ